MQGDNEMNDSDIDDTTCRVCKCVIDEGGKWCGDCMYDMSREEDRRKDERLERIN